MLTETATLPTAPDAAVDRSRDGYGALWKRVPRELGFLVLTLPLAIIGLSLISATFFAGIGTILLIFGVFLLIASLYIARGFGTLERIRLRWAGRPRVPAPEWISGRPGGSAWRRIVGPLMDGHYWLYLLHGMVVSPIISTFSWAVTIAWTSVGLGGVTYVIWGRFLPRGEQNVLLHQVVIDVLLPPNAVRPDPFIGEMVVYLIAGAFCILTLPFVTRGLTLLHWVIARAMLGAWRSEELTREVAALDASRGAAVHAEDAALRRLERDIHDGPQQRLIRLQMDIAAAQRKMEIDPGAAGELLAEAQNQAAETLDELRALSRGFAPPILQDRGLGPALQSLAARSALPVAVELRIEDDVRLAPGIERSAYFIAAELLANVAKHAHASVAGLFVDVHAGADARLDIWVTDDGRGGAEPISGHGLDGLSERVEGLRGQLVIDSPVGGPTRIGALIPLR